MGGKIMRGPLELVAIEFPGNHFKGEIIPELAELVNKRIIRVVDAVFIKKDKQGKVNIYELEEIDKDTALTFKPISGEIDTMVTQDDIKKVGEVLNNNSSAGLLLFENLWATKFVESVKRADGRMVLDYRIPEEIVEQVLQPAGSRG
jgi:uncharacterized membrane protein